MEANLIIEIISNGGMATFSIVALSVIAKTFYAYVILKDKEKDEDVKSYINDYKVREEKYIQIVHKFGDELSIVKECIVRMDNKIDTALNLKVGSKDY